MVFAAASFAGTAKKRLESGVSTAPRGSGNGATVTHPPPMPEAPGSKPGVAGSLKMVAWVVNLLGVLFHL